MKQRPTSLKEKTKVFLENLFGIVIIIPVVIVCWFIFPYVIIRDTIVAKGAIIWYTVSSRGGQLPNYILILLSLFLWWAALSEFTPLPHSLSIYRFMGFVETPNTAKLRRKKAKEVYSSLSPEEKAIQDKMDETLQNISFLGLLPDKPDQGRFSCVNCGYEWEVRIAKIYQRKQCGQCAVRYAKE
ncbi:hypothetical protein ACVR05_08295 [Streptococcus caprae]|uniref:Zinc ribbon domain-containing protein n=1 Tax=Streptococcus caprae TaxID=1640501 RepID=A0ABV8CSS0_9STRE